MLHGVVAYVMQVTCNVHGVASVFLDIGRSKAHKPPAGQHRFTKVRGGMGASWIWGTRAHTVRHLWYKLPAGLGLKAHKPPAGQHKFTKVRGSSGVPF
jgi:hypothetical protein